MGFATATKIIAEIDASNNEQAQECSFALATLSTELRTRLQNILSAMHEAYVRVDQTPLIES